jgi:predicted acyltransferase
LDWFQPVSRVGLLELPVQVFCKVAIAYFCGRDHDEYKHPVQAITAGSLLVVYWLLMILVPVPGFGTGVFTPEGNLHAYLDRLLLPGRLETLF